MANLRDDDIEYMFAGAFSAPSPTTGGTRTLANSPAFSGGDHNDNDNHQADDYGYWQTFSLEHVVAGGGNYYSFPEEILQPYASSTPMSLDEINAFLGDSFLNIGQDPVSGLDLLDFHSAVNGLHFLERHIGLAGTDVPSSPASLYTFGHCETKNYSDRAPLSRENQAVSVNPSSRSGHINLASQSGFDFRPADSNSYGNSIDLAVGSDFFNNDTTGPNYPNEGAELMADRAFYDTDSPNTLPPASPPELVLDEHHQRNARSSARTGKTVRWGPKGVRKIEKQKTVNALSSQIIVFDSIQGRSSKNPRLPFSSAKRREVAAVRAKGACFKCKMKRKKCDLGEPCQNCMEDPERCPDPTVVISQPCFRLNLEQCGFFRTESALWSSPLRKVMKWISNSPVRLSIQFILFHKPGPVLGIDCCHFTPENDDIVVRKVGPGDDQVMLIPTYCAPDLDVLQDQLPGSVGGYLKFVLERHSGNIPEVVARALHISLKRARKGKETDSILHAALDIWAGSRLCAAPRTLCGDKTLGLDRVRAAGAHDNGFIPIPPMLDYQLDSMMIDWMKGLMNSMLKELWKVLLKKGTDRKESWFDVFLTIFLLVNNLEYVYEDQMNFINSHGGAGVGYSGQHIATYSQPMLKLWKWSAEHLIFMFRYYIRKCAFGDAPIFSEMCFDNMVAAANLDESAQAYIRYIIEWVKGEGSGPQAREGNARNRDGKYQMVWCRELLLNTELPVSLM